MKDCSCNEYYVTGNIVTSPEPTVERLVDEFGHANNELASVIERLARRLAPVLRPNYTEHGCDGLSEAPPDVSAARYELNRICSLTETLDALLDRLEV